MSKDYEKLHPLWMTHWLKAAALYNLLWGAWVIFFPSHFFLLAGIPLPGYIHIWQGVGMIVGVYGVGYAIAAYNPYRHWPIVLVGFLGKLLGPVGIIYFVLRGEMNPAFLYMNITNDIVWLIPFGIILYQAARFHQNTESEHEVSFNDSINKTRTNTGLTLLEASRRFPLLIVFLRHSGCAFCRETASELAALQNPLRKSGKRLVIVSLMNHKKVDEFLSRYGIYDYHHVSDPSGDLYRAFMLRRGTFWQLFGPKNWPRGFNAAIVRKHGLGALDGDGFRMPGVFLLHNGKIIKEHRHSFAGEKIDYRPFVEFTAESPKRAPSSARK